MNAPLYMLYNVWVQFTFKGRQSKISSTQKFIHKTRRVFRFWHFSEFTPPEMLNLLSPESFSLWLDRVYPIIAGHDWLIHIYRFVYDSWFRKFNISGGVIHTSHHSRWSGFHVILIHFPYSTCTLWNPCKKLWRLHWIHMKASRKWPGFAVDLSWSFSIMSCGVNVSLTNVSSWRIDFLDCVNVTYFWTSDIDGNNIQVMFSDEIYGHYILGPCKELVSFFGNEQSQVKMSFFAPFLIVVHSLKLIQVPISVLTIWLTGL